MGNFVENQLEDEVKIKTAREVARFEEANDAIRPGPVTEPVQRPDEVPIEWDAVVRALRLPIPERPLQVEANLPHWFYAGDPDYIRRNHYWKAFAAKASEMRAVHASVRTTVNAFTNARQDPQVAALDFQLPPNVDGDLGSMADQVQLPEQGGRALGGLFYGNDSLALTPNDQIGMEGVASAVRDGHAPEIGEKRRVVYAADRRLTASLRNVGGAVKRLERMQAKLSSAIVALGRRASEQRASDVQARIDALQAEIQSTQSVVQRTASFFAAIAHVAEGGVGDAIEKIGELASEAVSHSHDAQLAALSAEKLAATVDGASFLDEQLRLSTREGLAGVAEASHGLAAQIDGVLIALSERRSAYSGLGASVGSHVPAEQESSRGKLAAIPAALPIVEMVVAKAGAIREAAAIPRYDEGAGRGLGMAQRHNHPAGASFLEAARDVISSAHYGTKEEETWRRRRDQLFVATDRMVGPRPEPTKRESPPE